MRYGVIVGKFQTPALTDGHKTLIKLAAENSDELVIFIFNKEISFSLSNPLSYDTREKMLANFVINEVKKKAHFYGLSDQKYASVLQKSIDDTLEIHHECGTKHTATLFGGPGNFAESYSGKFDAEIVNFVRSRTSSELRDIAYNTENATTIFNTALINALKWREPVCHNYIVPIVTAFDGSEPVILVDSLPTMKKLTIPTFEVVGRFDSFAKQSIAELKDIFPTLMVTSGSQLESVRIDDWRFRHTHDFCYYHLIFHKAINFPTPPEDISWLRRPNAETLESEYHSLLPIINRVV